MPDAHPTVPAAVPDPGSPTVATASRSPNRGDRIMLQGPHSRWRELWLLLQTVRDFLHAFRVLHFVGPCVTVFGSARFGEDHPYYRIGRVVGRRLSEMGFTVMTGGGPGLMAAANQGARDAGGLSVGCNIHLPVEQQPNRFLDRWVTCEHFFVRKVVLFKYSYAFVALPGGIGTMDELFEALTLIQNRKVARFPIVMIGESYWQPLRDYLRQMDRAGAITSADLELFLITDDLDLAMAHLERNAVDRFRLRARRRPRPLAWLGENVHWPGAPLPDRGSPG